MNQLLLSSNEGWNLTRKEKLLKKILSKFRGKKNTYDTSIKLSDLLDESLTSSCANSFSVRRTEDINYLNDHEISEINLIDGVPDEGKNSCQHQHQTNISLNKTESNFSDFLANNISTSTNTSMNKIRGSSHKEPQQVGVLGTNNITFDSDKMQNSEDSQDTKVFKLKITVPRGTLREFRCKEQKINFSISNENIREENISCDQEATTYKFSSVSPTPSSGKVATEEYLDNTKSDSCESENLDTNCISVENKNIPEVIFTPLHKSSQTMEPAHHTVNTMRSPNLIDSDENSSFSFSDLQDEHIKTLVNKSVNCPPIMGRRALLAKTNTAKCRNENSKSDPEIIEKLVIDRFTTFLQNYYQRSFKRAVLRRERCAYSDDDDDDDDINNSEPDLANKTTASISSSNTVLNHRNGEEINTCDVVCSRSLASKSDGGFGSAGTRSRSSSEPSASHSHESLVSIDSLSKLTNNEKRGDNVKCEGEFVDDLQYDSQSFLREALGEDIDISTGVGDQTLDDMNITINSVRSSGRAQSVDHSIGTSDLSALISKASSFYSLVSKKMRRSATTLFKQTLINEERLRTPSVYEECSNSDRIVQLTYEAAVQHNIIHQTSKALDFCKNTKEFVSSVEQIEAERILLVAASRLEVIKEEINRLASEETNEAACKNLGSVTISYLRFPGKEDPEASELQKKREFSQWFVCIANHGLKLFSTNAVLPEEDGSVCFTNTFEFDSLLPDFAIHIAIYSIKIKNNMRNYSHESKFHLNENDKRTCLSPQKLFHLHKEKSKSTDSVVRISSFTLWGRTTLRIGDLSKSNVFKLSNVPLCAKLEGMLTMNIMSSVKLEERYSGFLNIGTDSRDCITWNRRWCSVQGSEVKYWNYPHDEEACAPLKVLDLSYCANSWITTVDRSICPKSKTLLLEIITLPNVPANRMFTKEPKYTIVRHFLAADTSVEMKNWEKCLNSIVSSLRNWNSMKCQIIFSKDAT